MLSKAFTLALEDWEWINGNDKPFSKISYERENNERDRSLYFPEYMRLTVLFQRDYQNPCF